MQRLLVLLLVLLVPTAALAERPKIMSDGLLTGARWSPNTALALAWEFDIEVAGIYTMGTALHANFGSEGGNAGQTQDLMLMADLLRLKIPLTGGSGYRPYMAFGAGVNLTWLSASEDVRNDLGRLLHRAQPAALEVNGQITLGFGVESYMRLGRHLRMAYQVTALTHFRIGESSRVPEVWGGILMGLRYGR